MGTFCVIMHHLEIGEREGIFLLESVTWPESVGPIAEWNDVRERDK